MFRSVTVAVVVFSVCSVGVWAAEPPDHLKPQLERMRKWQEQEISRLEKHLEGLQTAFKDARFDREKRRPMKEQIELTETRIDDIKRGALPIATVDAFKLSMGQIGTLVVEKLEVLEVLSKASEEGRMLVVPIKTKKKSVGGMGGGTYSARSYGRSLQQAILNTHTYRYEESGEPFMLYGYPTEGLVSGQKLELLDGLVEAEGTERYEIGFDLKTMFKLRWYDVDALRPYLKQNVSQPPEKDAEPTPSVPRTWTDATGNFTLEATFRGVIGGNVRLEKADGSVISIPLEKLSEADQEWIREQAKR